MAELPFDEGLELLEKRTTLARIAIWAVIGFSVVSMIGELLEAAGAIDIEYGSPVVATILGFAYLGEGVAFLVSAIIVGMWIYRAHANLFAFGLDDLEFSPGWSVGWFFVPIMSLFRPFQAMRELWNASRGIDADDPSTASGLLGPWWGAYLVGNILDQISFRLASGATDANTIAASNGIGAGGSALTCVSAWFLLQIVDDVLDGQRNRLRISEAFA